MIHIIAGTYDQFRIFRANLYNHMAQEGMNPRYTDIVYLSGPESLKGFNNPWGYRVGSWYHRDNLELIEQLLLQAGSNINEFIEIEGISFQ